MSKHAVLVLVCAIGVASSATAPAGAQESRACAPPGGIQEARTARGLTPGGGSEVTEFYAGGAYRVTVCDARTRFVSSTTVAPFQDPEDGKKVLVPISRQTPSGGARGLLGDPADPNYAAQWRANRKEIFEQVPGPTRRELTPDPAYAARSHGSPPASSVAASAPPKLAFSSEAGRILGASLASPPRQQRRARAAQTPAACQDNVFSQAGQLADGGYHWQWHAASFGNNLDTAYALTYGQGGWDSTWNDCGIADVNYGISAMHTGDPGFGYSRTWDVYPVMDRGPMTADCAAFVACTSGFAWWDGTRYWLAQNDVRFSNAVAWTNRNAPDAYDYWAAAAHEVGHLRGLDDVYASGGMTMFYKMSRNETKKRTLGLGDINLHKAMYQR